MKISLHSSLLALALTAMLATTAPVFAQEATPEGQAPENTGVEIRDVRPDENAKPANDERPTRRGIFGEAARVGEASLVLSTRWGDIEVLVTDATVIKHPRGEATLAAIEPGNRLAVLLDRSPADPDSGATDLRSVKALQIHAIPTKPEREHQRAVVSRSCNADGTITVVAEDGTESEVDAECDRERHEAGEDRIMLVRGEGAGRPEQARKRVVASLRTDEVSDRLSDLATRVEGAGKRALLEEMRTQAAERAALRLEEVEASLSEEAAAAKDALVRARQAAQDGLTKAQAARKAAVEAFDRASGPGTEAAAKLRQAAERLRQAEERKREAIRDRIADPGATTDAAHRPTPAPQASRTDGSDRPTPEATRDTTRPDDGRATLTPGVDTTRVR